MCVYKFRKCYLNTVERQVVKDGKHLELTPKTYDVLELLVRKRGEIVTKEEILDRVWNGSFVEEANLPVHISKLRRILGKSKIEPFIETVQGSGYRFISPVETVGEEEWLKILPSVNAANKAEYSSESKLNSIAVLPLQNENDNVAIEYLADGLTEGIINSLSLNTDLRVMARNTVFRYKDKYVNVKELGATLGVATILTGRIRILENNLMISVELVKVEDETQLWGTQFNQTFSDIFEIQEKIIAAVTERLKSEISSVVGTRRNTHTPDSESYRLYLKGKYFLERRSISNICKAIEFFQKSVSYDPTNVFSYIEMIEGYILLYGFDHISYDAARAAIKPLLDVTSQLNQAIDVLQVMYAGVNMYLDWEFRDAEKRLKYALQINPNCVMAHYRYAKLLMLEGRFSEASKELHKVMLIDPLSVINYKRIGKLFYCMKRYENAVIYLKEVLELEASDYEALIILGAALTELGKYDEALNIFDEALKLHFNLETLSMIGYTNACAGRKSETRRIIEQIKLQSKDNHRDAIKIARIYATLSEREDAYSCLENAFSHHDVDLIALNSDPRWTSISHEPKFRELIQRVGISAQ